MELQMKLLKQYLFKEYPLYITISNSQRIKYYYKNSKIPKNLLKCIEEETVTFIPKQFTEKGKKILKEVLVDTKNYLPIPANRKQVGKPKTSKIAGQRLHELTLAPYERSLIIETLKKYFIKQMKEQGTLLLVFTENLYFEFIYEVDKKYISSDDIGKGENVGDFDNHKLFYEKVLFDCMNIKLYRKEEGKLEDNPVGFLPSDNVNYVNDYRTTFIHTQDCRNLTLKIYDKTS